MYRRTSGKDYIRQIAGIERREARLRRLRSANSTQGMQPDTSSIFVSTPESHHHVANSQNDAVEIRTFLNQNSGDPAIKVCNNLAWFDKIVTCTCRHFGHYFENMFYLG